MARVKEGQSHPVSDESVSFIVHAAEVAQALGRFVDGVDWFDERLPPAPAPLVQVRRVRLHDVRRVAQHVRTKVTRGEGAVDIALKARSYQVGDIPAVIDVRVG